jgi:hypothetical protein
MSVQTRLHFDRSQDAVTVERVQDVEGILEHNKILRDQTQTNTDGLKHIANIPNVILERWLNEEYARGNIGLRLFSDEFNQMVHRKLRDPEWKFLRTDK